MKRTRSLVAVCAALAFGGSGYCEPKLSSSQTSTGGALRETISVNVDDLDALLKKAEAAKTKPVLFLNGQEIKGVFGVAIQAPVAGQTGTLLFHLERTAANQDAWKPLLSRPGLSPATVRLSVGLPGERPLESTTNFQLTVLHVNWLVAWLILFLIPLVVFFFYSAKRSNIVRETGPVPAGSVAAFSLGRCQMAWWFFLVISAYLFLYMVTWDFDTITAGTLGLIGISAGTALAGAVVDTSKNTSLAAERTQLLAELAGVPAPSVARIAEINKRLAEIDKQTATPLHTTWSSDILSDANGMSFHRFQMFVWTIVLGIIFMISVYNDLIMPNFSATLLGLMGISSGTYVGFKFPENKN